MKALQINISSVNARPHPSSLWLFPGLYLSTILLNQPNSLIGAIGQVIGWINILAALHILITNRWNKMLVISLTLGLIISRMGRIVFAYDWIESMYTMILNAIYCFAGSVIVFKSINMLYKQVLWLALINFLFMILQVVGVGAWTQALSTYGEGNFAEPVTTLLVTAQDIIHKSVQLRPAGISYSTVILTILILFGIILHYSRKQDRLRWGSIVLVGMVVFSMGKMVMIGFVMISLWIFLSGNSWQRKGVIHGVLLFVLIIALYKQLFPGLWEINTSSYTISTSFYLRLNDIIRFLNPNGYLYNQGMYYLKNTASVTWIGHDQIVSGYSLILSRSKALSGLLLGGFIAYVIGLRKLHKQYPELTGEVVISMTIFLALPFMYSYWGVSLYWFMASIALQPILMILMPGSFKYKLS